MIRGRIATLPAAFGLLSAAACGDTTPGGDAGVTVRDSAGVEIVEHAGDVWSAPEAWHLSPEPVLTIGVAEGEEPYLLDGVTGVLPLSDGRLVVANSGDRTLRWFDEHGMFLFQRGGSGEGPGEFSRLGLITLGAADTIMAVDWVARRITTFAGDGTLGPTRRVEGLAAPPGAVFSLADGSLVMGASGFSTQQLGDRTEPGIMRLPSPLLRLAADGTVDTVGIFPGAEMEVRQMSRGFGIGPAGFGKNFVYAADRDRIYVGTADRVVIDVLTPDGRLVRSIRALDVDLTVAPEVIDTYKERARASIADLPEQARPEAERQVSEMKLPTSKPAYSSFLIDSDGNVWVAEYRLLSLPGTPRWAVFDPEGGLVTVVAVPAGLRVLAITRDRLIGRSSDDLGVQHVVAYTIER